MIIAILCEEVRVNIYDYLNSRVIVALTAKACYQLNKIGIRNYYTLEDFYYPYYDIPSHLLEYDNKYAVFNICFQEYKQTEMFWENFLNNFWESIKPNVVIYWGDYDSKLRGLINERKYKEITPKDY